MIPSKVSALRYWEARRIFFILLVLVAGDFAWGISNSFNAGIDDMPGARYTDPGALRSLFAIFVAANAIYSLGYVAEYFLEGRRWWPNPSRTVLVWVLSLAACLYAIRSAQVVADRLSMRKMIWPAMYGIERRPNNSPEATPGQRPPLPPSPSSGAPQL